jgi:predicted transcriptional regulator
LNGNKRFEFRKVPCRKEVDKIIIYATSPVMKVVGEADVIGVIVDLPEQVWELTSEYAGISKPFYDQYYEDREIAVAYRLGNIRKYKQPLTLANFGLHSAPQSFVYV